MKREMRSVGIEKLIRTMKKSSRGPWWKKLLCEIHHRMTIVTITVIEGPRTPRLGTRTCRDPSAAG